MDFFRPRRFGGSGEVSEVESVEALGEIRGFILWVFGRKKGVEMLKWDSVFWGFRE